MARTLRGGDTSPLAYQRFMLRASIRNYFELREEHQDFPWCSTTPESAGKAVALVAHVQFPDTVTWLDSAKEVERVPMDSVQEEPPPALYGPRDGAEWTLNDSLRADELKVSNAAPPPVPCWPLLRGVCVCSIAGSCPDWHASFQPVRLARCPSRGRDREAARRYGWHRQRPAECDVSS